jgi:hypothetical protein
MTVTGVQLGLVGRGITGSCGARVVKQQGDRFDLELDYSCSTVAGAKAVRQQLLGYDPPSSDDQIWVPFSWDQDPTFDGFYYVKNVEVPTDTPLLNVGRVRASVDLERVRPYSAPVIESVLFGDRRPHSAGYSGFQSAWLAYPNSWKAFDFLSGDGDETPSSGRSLTASLKMWVLEQISTYSFTFLQGPAPATFYDGAVLLRSSGEVVTGRQIVSDPTSWEIDNGLIKVSASAASNAMFDFVTRLTNGSAWSTLVRSLNITHSTATAGGPIPWGGTAVGDATRITVPQRVSVIRNSPEMVTLCLTYPAYGGSTVQQGRTGALHLYLSLRRGARTVNVSVSCQRAMSFGIAFEAGWTSAGFTHFGNAFGSTSTGLRETTANVDNQCSYLLSGSASQTLSSTTPEIYSTGGAAVNLADFGVGAMPFGGSGADAQGAILSQYMVASTESLQVISS